MPKIGNRSDTIEREDGTKYSLEVKLDAISGGGVEPLATESTQFLVSKNTQDTKDYLAITDPDGTPILDVNVVNATDQDILITPSRLVLDNIISGDNQGRWASNQYTVPASIDQLRVINIFTVTAGLGNTIITYNIYIERDSIPTLAYSENSPILGNGASHIFELDEFAVNLQENDIIYWEIVADRIGSSISQAGNAGVTIYSSSPDGFILTQAQLQRETALNTEVTSAAVESIREVLSRLSTKPFHNSGSSVIGAKITNLIKEWSIRNNGVADLLIDVKAIDDSIVPITIPKSTTYNFLSIIKEIEFQSTGQAYIVIAEEAL